MLLPLPFQYLKKVSLMSILASFFPSIKTIFSRHCHCIHVFLLQMQIFYTDLKSLCSPFRFNFLQTERDTSSSAFKNKILGFFVFFFLLFFFWLKKYTCMSDLIEFNYYLLYEEYLVGVPRFNAVEIKFDSWSQCIHLHVYYRINT